jgi:hypothetical protein
MKFLLVLILATTMAACAERSSDEQQVRELIAAMADAAKSRDASDVLEHVADDYASDEGTDKRDLGNFLRGYFLANPTLDVQVDVESLEVPVAGLVQARLGVSVLPANDQTTVDVEFRRRDGEWQVVRADRIRD